MNSVFFKMGEMTIPFFLLLFTLLLMPLNWEPISWKSKLDGHGSPHRPFSYFHPRLFFFFTICPFIQVTIAVSCLRPAQVDLHANNHAVGAALSVCVCVCVSRQISSWNQGIESMRAAIWSHTHLSMKQEIMADGPRCKRRKQANPRRKNGKKITGETIQAVGGDICGCKPGLKVSTAVRGRVCPRLVRLSAFPFYAGIKGPLSGGEAARNCVRVEAPVEPLEC